MNKSNRTLSSTAIARITCTLATVLLIIATPFMVAIESAKRVQPGIGGEAMLFIVPFLAYNTFMLYKNR